MSKRVLVTGAAGFIGHHTVEHLLTTTDWEIVCLVSFKHRGDSVRLQHLLDPRVTVLYHDLVAPLSPRLIGRIGEIDYVMNVASESHVDRSITEPVPFVQNNVAVALNMLEYARVAKPEIFIQVSTDEVYGPANPGHAHAEGEPHRPSNPYSASKSAQEAIAYSYWRTFSVPVVITNTMNNFGERQDGEKFVPMLMRKIAAGEMVDIHAKPVQRRTKGWKGNVPGWEPGSRMYLHARNHADALRFICERGAPAMYPAPDLDRWNVVGDREIDNLRMATMIARLMGRQLLHRLVDFHSSRPGHDPRYALDGSKLRDAGWVAPISFTDSLRRTVEWTQNSKEWCAA